ncbi:hypothetical protein RFI_39716 [Reticulomyxa filosa]|uniref:Uncharacterized protein n=1 Tax=Reticulomyxa filosa TaxID=46433 RepID=X6L9K1_RETFI|nr:hypothetical protein RFI_39716 [Reticulomyxa filosa]|eukprot:ETN97811.1 hypothetical protein RFI_39716 [Reticulomyxa filosa]
MQLINFQTCDGTNCDSNVINGNLKHGIRSNQLIVNDINQLEIPVLEKIYKYQRLATQMDIDNNPTNNRKRKLDNDYIYDLNTKKRRTNEQSLQVQVSMLSEVDEKKKDEEINFEIIQIFKYRDRHNLLCSSSPTLVITSIQAKELKSATSALKFIDLKNRINYQEKSKRRPKCQIYLRNYVDEIKKRKQQGVFNHELNKIVLLKNVPVRESEKEIKETLED